MNNAGKCCDCKWWSGQSDRVCIAICLLWSHRGPNRKLRIKTIFDHVGIPAWIETEPSFGCICMDPREATRNEG